MSSFSELLLSNQRLVILRALECAPGCKANDALLEAVLSSYGLATPRRKVHALLIDLAGEDGARITSPSPLVLLARENRTWVAQITEDGLALARGLDTLSGVARPSPDAAALMRSSAGVACALAGEGE